MIAIPVHLDNHWISVVRATCKRNSIDNCTGVYRVTLCHVPDNKHGTPDSHKREASSFDFQQNNE